MMTSGKWKIKKNKNCTLALSYPVINEYVIKYCGEKQDQKRDMKNYLSVCAIWLEMVIKKDKFKFDDRSGFCKIQT